MGPEGLGPLSKSKRMFICDFMLKFNANVMADVTTMMIWKALNCLDTPTEQLKLLMKTQVLKFVDHSTVVR